MAAEMFAARRVGAQNAGIEMEDVHCLDLLRRLKVRQKPAGDWFEKDRHGSGPIGRMNLVVVLKT